MESKPTNTLYLFGPQGITGLIITQVTGCPWSHSAIETGGVIYDSSETRGNFGVASKNIFRKTWLGKRKYVVYEFQGDLSEWIRDMSGTKYDWRGVLGWLFGLNCHKRFYCFEASWWALRHVGILPTQPQPDRISGCDLEYIMINHKKQTEETT